MLNLTFAQCSARWPRLAKLSSNALARMGLQIRARIRDEQLELRIEGTAALDAAEAEQRLLVSP